MVINEFLPNPDGKDADGEFIELFNNSNSIVNLSGWQIKDLSGKTFKITGKIVDPGEYLILDYKTTKISLNNDGETIFLYDASGQLIDKAEFAGQAASGKSLARDGNRFVFSGSPTPGKENILDKVENSKIVRAENSLAQVQAPEDSGERIYLRNELQLGNFLIGTTLALILASVFVAIYKKLNLESGERDIN